MGNRSVALYTRPSSGAITTRYFLHDHQGSVAEITDSSGGFHVGESFGAFGARRDAADWDGPVGAGDEAAIADATPRGYTFHSNLDGSALIHMNGRVADGLSGRFLSPDPYVPYPGNTQSFNRFSYVHNNPLTFTDPSGFTLEFDWPDIDGAMSLSFRWSKRSGSRHRVPPVVFGCFVPSAEACYGKAGSSKLLDMIFDILGGPLPGYGQYDDLVLYYTDPTGFGRFENEIILVQDIATGVFYEFILLPIEEAAEGRLLSAACKFVKLCRIAERWGGKVVDYVFDKGKRYLRREIDDLTQRVEIPRSRYPEGAAHVEAAQAAGHPSRLTIDRPGTPANRSAAQAGHERPQGMDLDEYPPAMFREGGAGASVRPMTPAQNRGMGACIGNQCRGLPDGTQVDIVVVD
ncbi:MAG: RHS repeat-associated core domain-containing protein [Woeseiaceae bacterium]